MPSAIPRSCRKLGCPKTTTDRAGYCDDHRNEGWQQHQRGQSRHQRGYGSKWDIIRARILKRDRHICQQCIKGGKPVPASTVDHIKPKAHGGTDDDCNLQSLCWPCHKAKTATERSRQGPHQQPSEM
ncbi:HNH endonuclease [Pantoea sp. CCBC3-3-1]|uniref:HNH endonuclease n=1 Tax=Pantoea sp. CCBC3-3-1 TaxID=2490851 RepID=UPI0011BF09DF|nr:HNH endonuclease [Pantoea sp. CCBC3-3-1]